MAEHSQFVREKGSLGAVDHPISSRADIDAMSFRAALQRCLEGKSELGCSCRRNEGIWPPIYSRPLPKDRFACVRLRVEEHGAGCIFSLIYGNSSALPLSLALFASPRECTSGGAGVGPDSGRSNPNLQHLEFSAFAMRSMAEACVEAFIAANRSCLATPRFQPTAADFFVALDEFFRRPMFAGDLSAFDGARSTGAELVFGVILQQPTPGGGPEAWIEAFLWQAGRMAGELLVGKTTDIQSSLASQKNNYGHALAAPYIAIALLEPNRAVRRLWVQAIWADGTCLCAVKSEYERNYAAFLRKKNSCFLKPMRPEDMQRLVALLGKRCSNPDALRLLPDFFYWKPESPDPSLVTVAEVQGSPRNDEEPSDYHKQLDLKAASYCKLGEGWRYLEIPGWKVEKAPRPPRTPEEWRSPPMEGSHLGSAAVAWIERKFSRGKPA